MRKLSIFRFKSFKFFALRKLPYQLLKYFKEEVLAAFNAFSAFLKQFPLFLLKLITFQK